MRVAIVARGRHPIVERAAVELASYLEKIWDAEVVVTDEIGEAELDIVIGTLDALEATAELPKSLEAECYAVRSLAPDRVVVAGGDPLGMLFGCYALLEEWGVRFYLSGDSLPGRRTPPPADVPSLDGSPRTRLRGGFPYYDFLTGPSTWNLVDYRRYFEQLLRLRMNAVCLHFYSFEPFVSFEFRGIRFDGYLDTSRTSRWTKRPADLSTIEIGREHLGAYLELGTFGADSAILEGSVRERAEAAQRTLREALAYAKELGLQVAVGVEVMDPPLEMRAAIALEERYDGGMHVCPSSASAEELLRSWLQALVDTYPQADTYLLWQTETFAARFSGGCPCEACEMFRHAHPLRPYDVSDLLAPETAVYYHASDIERSDQTFLQWALLGYGILRELAPEKRVGLSGWYVEHMFRDASPYVPSDLILTSITEVEPCLSPPFLAFYAGVSQERWAINWWEIDFRMWLPQPKVSMYPPVLEKVREHGIDGLMMLHWRTRTVDDNARYSALLHWTPDITPHAYYEQLFTDEWGREAAPIAASALLELEDHEVWLTKEMGWQVLAQDWAPPTVCLALEQFSTRLPLSESATAQFRSLLDGVPRSRQRLRAVHEKLMEAERLGQRQREGDRAGWWIDRVEFYLLYLDVIEYVCAAVLHYARAIGGTIVPQSRDGMHELGRAYRLLRAAPVRAFIEKFASRIEDRGDLGTLVNLNFELWARYREATDAFVRVFDLAAVTPWWFARGRSDGGVDPPATGPDALVRPAPWEKGSGPDPELLAESRRELLPESAAS